MSTTTAPKTIEVLRQLFCKYGLPDQIVSDNGPQFISTEFAVFLKQNGVKHTRSAPYHPATNGLAERFVQTMKQALKASKNSELSLSHRLCNFLLTYRSSPHATTGVSPALLFLNREVRTRFDLLRPSPDAHIRGKQSTQKFHHDKHSRLHQFQLGQKVMVKNLHSGSKWIPAVIVELLGPLSYLIETADKELWRRHIDMIKECTTTTNSTTPQQGTDYGDSVPTERNCGFESPASGVTSETSTSTSETSETEVRYSCTWCHSSRFYRVIRGLPLQKLQELISKNMTST